MQKSSPNQKQAMKAARKRDTRKARKPRGGGDANGFARTLIWVASVLVLLVNVNEYLKLSADMAEAEASWNRVNKAVASEATALRVNLNETRRAVMRGAHARSNERQGESGSLNFAETKSLLANVGAHLLAPSDAKKVIILGVNFITNRDAAIWDYTFGRAGYTTSRLTKKKLMRGQDNDFRALKCLDLFDGKPHCFDPSMLLSIKRYQRVSRLYGLRDTLWSKDKFCETMSASLRGFNVEREFVFPCWMLPRDSPILMKQVKNEYADRSFILKPADRGEGSGIVIFDKASDLPRWKRSFPDLDEVVVQTYLPDPYLIDGYKWDMRTYVLVTSIHPLRAYMFRDGLVRFAATPYDPKRKAGALTNTSLNKNKTKSVDDLTWPFPKVYRWLKRKGHDPDQLWDRIEAAVTMMLLSAEPGFVKKFQKLQRGYACANCYQLLGVDVIVDSTVTPRVIEVNGEPSMLLSGQDGSQYDRTKTSMTHDLVQLVYSNDDSSLQLTADLMELEFDGVRLGFEGSATGCRADVYDVCLSKRDVEYLLEMKREEGKMGGFRRLYPRADGARFDKLIDHLKTKFPGDVNEGSFRIHRVATALSKFTSRIRFQNTIDDPEYVE